MPPIKRKESVDFQISSVDKKFGKRRLNKIKESMELFYKRTRTPSFLMYYEKGDAKTYQVGTTILKEVEIDLKEHFINGILKSASEATTTSNVYSTVPAGQEKVVKLCDLPEAENFKVEQLKEIITMILKPYRKASSYFYRELAPPDWWPVDLPFRSVNKKCQDSSGRAITWTREDLVILYEAARCFFKETNCQAPAANEEHSLSNVDSSHPKCGL